MDGDKKSETNSPVKAKVSTEENKSEENLPAASAVLPDSEQRRDNPNVDQVSKEESRNTGNPSTSSEQCSGNENLSILDVIFDPSKNFTEHEKIRAFYSRSASPAGLYFSSLGKATERSGPNLLPSNPTSSEQEINENLNLDKEIANLKEAFISHSNPNEACGGTPSSNEISCKENFQKLVDLGMFESLDDLLNYKFPDSLFEKPSMGLPGMQPSEDIQPQVLSRNEENIDVNEANPDVNQISKTEGENADLRQNPNEGDERSRRMRPLFVEIPDDRYLAGASAFLHDCANAPPLPSSTNQPLLSAANQPVSGQQTDDYVTSQIAKYEAAAEEIDKFVDYMNNLSLEK